ncbi:MAG TPA: hypothetical protein PK924_06940 [Bacilli bacterium]|jgi:hypothetical protein|nr:hypothetical protein [Bacilli bacterium]
MVQVKVGVMPGQINEFVVEEGTSIAKALEIAGLNPTGYEVKVDGYKVTDLENEFVNSDTHLILLTKMIKGNN